MFRKPAAPAPADEAKPVQPPPHLEVPEVPVVTPPADANGTELDRLREILYGTQARTTDKRLLDLEVRVETQRRELTESLLEKTNLLGESAGSQLASVRKDLSDRLDRQVTDQAAQLRMAQQNLNGRIDEQNASQTAQLRAAQKDLADRLDRQSADQAAQLRAVQRELSDRIESVYADVLTQLRAVQKDLTDRLDRFNTEQADRFRSLQAETRQRDDGLRQELLSLATSLDTKKTSRQDLSQMLVELGQRLRNDNETPTNSR
jgi:hypothetical protein